MLFTPVVRTSNSIVKSLLEFSKDRKISVKLLDFELLSVETLIKRDGEDNYSIVNSENPISQDDIENEFCVIIQEYEIKIKPKTKDTTLLKDVKITVATNKLKTKVVLTIHKGSIFPKYKTIMKEFKNLVLKKKLYAGVFINIFEDDLNIKIKKLFASIAFNKPIPHDIKFNIAHCLEPVMPTDAKLEKIFEQKEINKENILDDVEIDEHIANYIKPKSGKDTRACNGHYIKIREPKIINIEPIIDEDTIYTKEDESKIYYFAKESGYVVLKDNHISISKILHLHKADFKSTAHIEDNKDNKDISVHIKHQQTDSEDAIESGVNIDVKDLNVDGSVGSNVKIKTENLNIDAQTHRNSKMSVENQADIKLHRGDLNANDAKIDMLETGKVEAKNSIYIKNMLGGEAIAPVVIVDNIISNCTIIASQKIEIHSIDGENNKLIIDPKQVTSYNETVKNLKEKIKIKKSELKELDKDFTKRYEKHIEKLDRIKVFKTRVAQAQKLHKEPMKQDLIRIREYKQESLKFEEERKDIVAFENELKKLEDELNIYLTQDMHAKVVSTATYDGNTKVIFKELNKDQELSILPNGLIKNIYLTYNEKNEKIITTD